jgi:GH35 family endo-1,4-beta-xylanase
MKLQYARIERCAKRFGGAIDFWDVVNEATNYDRPHCRQHAPKLTNAIRNMGVGPFVRGAFASARKGNPNAGLIINDYVTTEAYAAKVIEELTDDERKPMYDVIGIQSHQHGGAWPTTKIWEVCDRFARYGKPLHFTETTFLSGEIGWNLRDQRRKTDKNWVWASTPEGEKRQADDVVRFYTVLFSHPAVEAITWWDFTDQNSWQGAPCGFLRHDMTPKPAYHALLDLVKGKWWTKTEAKTAGAGKVAFRGFFGDYRVTVGTGDDAVTGTFAFDKTTKGPIEVRLK